MATQPAPLIWHKGPLTAVIEPTDMVTLAGVPLPLFPRAMAILVLLVAADFVELKTLMTMVKSVESLRVHMSSIRQYLPNGITLENDERKGYRLVLKL
jgi:hypothetical protein